MSDDTSAPAAEEIQWAVDHAGPAGRVAVRDQFGCSHDHARKVVAAARDGKQFCMEAMWTRFLPLWTELRRRIADGAIGEVRMVQADFGFRAGWNPQGRLLNPALGGGSLLDVGVYCVSLAYSILGAPAEIATRAHIGETGVDEQAAFILAYDGGQLAVLCSAVRTSTQHEAFIWGTEGRVHVHSPWWKPTRATLAAAGKDEQVIEMPFEGNGYQYEAAEVGRCLAEGRLESDVMPLDETLSIMEALDRIRAQWGLKYPTE